MIEANSKVGQMIKFPKRQREGNGGEEWREWRARGSRVRVTEGCPTHGLGWAVGWTECG